MLYGKSKEREMMRSVLPSTRRAGARDELNGIRRKARRKFRQNISTLTGTASDVIDGWDDSNINGDYYPTHRIRYAVRDRRNGDKVAPLMRWAVARTSDLPPEDRLPAIERIMPNNLIGRHAVDHVRWLTHFSDHDRTYYGRYNRYIGTHRIIDRQTITEIATKAIANGLLGDLNTYLKRHTRFYDFDLRRFVSNARLLYGAHDIDDFVDDVLRVPRPTVVRRHTDRFLLFEWASKHNLIDV